MKKIIIVIFSLVFLSSNVFANNKYLSAFDKWLLDNDHTQYLNFEHKAGCKKLIQKHGLKVPKVGLFDEPKVKTNEWFWLECDEFQATNNLKIKFYDGWIPEKNVKPNYGTLVYELFRFIVRPFKVQRVGKYEVEPSSNPYEFRSSLKEDKYFFDSSKCILSPPQIPPRIPCSL